MPIIKLAPSDNRNAPKDQELYDYHWEIPDWKEIMENERLVTSQKLVFETGHNLSSSSALKTTWLVGLKAVSGICDKDKKFARLYWQLLDIQGINKDQKLTVTVGTNLLDWQGFSAYNDWKKEIVGVGDCIDSKTIHPELEICNWLSVAYKDVVNIIGSVVYYLDLTIDLPPLNPDYSEDKTYTFSKVSNESLCNNFGALLENGTNSDIKIVSSDNVEFAVHQLVLSAQCPVFAGMLNSDLSERKCGIIKTTDISGKTMKILLTYFYTGRLLENWMDDDIIVEFTYAAGKYQMSPVLEMLDDQLGKRKKNKVEATQVDIQLLQLAEQLSLKNAENELLQFVVAKIKRINKCADLFELLDLNTNEIIKKAETKLGVTTVLKVWNDSLGDNQFQDTFNSNVLLVLAMAKGKSRKIERALLKRFAKIVDGIKNADEFFKIVG